MDLENQRPLQFRPVNDENREEAEKLEVFSEQTGFIESVSECLQEADRLERWRPVGIYQGDALVGFAMYGYFPNPSPGQLWLDRLLIDKRFQGKGYGRRAVLALLDRLHREYTSDRVYLSVYEENTHAVRLYRQIGFRFNGEKDTKGEKVMVYTFGAEG
ncbi:MAG: GNAT family N-acetyltransferase [Provencibacterium sp.]|jgi:diamine N-acetyltransferase|nr:GNAT family N-acetyltransferase [Provencibacterium sp.]